MIEYTLDGVSGAEPFYRLLTTILVKQEFYGLLLAHYAIRGLMHKAALKGDTDPDTLLFIHTVRVIHRKLPRFFSIPPKEKNVFHEVVLNEILEERVVSSRGRRNYQG